ncbi:hypothetical protein ACHQM5_024669 [Ranunculus cassubicifolius]
MSHVPTFTFDNYNQGHCSPAFDGARVLSTSSHCKKPVVFGVVRMDEITNADLYRVRIDDIYDYETDMFKEDGKHGDISMDNTITWPKGAG